MRARLPLFAFWAAGSLWDLLRTDFVRGIFDHLGYPHYLARAGDLRGDDPRLPH